MPMFSGAIATRDVVNAIIRRLNAVSCFSFGGCLTGSVSSNGVHLACSLPVIPSFNRIFDSSYNTSTKAFTCTRCYLPRGPITIISDDLSVTLPDTGTEQFIGIKLNTNDNTLELIKGGSLPDVSDQTPQASVYVKIPIYKLMSNGGIWFVVDDYRDLITGNEYV